MLFNSIDFVIFFPLVFVLFYFKYFIASFIDAFSILGRTLEGSLLNIVLPAYTFQTLSYSIDIYRRKFKSINNVSKNYGSSSYELSLEKLTKNR